MLIAVIELSADVSLPSAALRRPSAAVMALPLATILPSAAVSLESRPEKAEVAIALALAVTLKSRLSTVV